MVKFLKQKMTTITDKHIIYSDCKGNINSLIYIAFFIKLTIIKIDNEKKSIYSFMLVYSGMFLYYDTN